jgi:DNA-binding IclR family transcriptional regulator
MSSDAAEPEPASRSMDIQAVGKAAQVLALFDTQRPELSVAAVAKELRMNRTTAHRYLTSMEHAGLLARTPAGYEAGPLVIQVGALGLGRRTLLQVAPEHLRALRDRVHLTTTISTWGMNGPVIVHVEEDHSRELLLTVALGTQLHLEAAHSQIWLAFGDDPLRAERLLAMVSPESRDRIERSIEVARSRGLAVRTSPAEGYVAVAAPVFDRTGLVGAMAVLGTQHTLDEPVDGPQAEALVAAAEGLSAALQGRSPASPAATTPVE